MSTTTPLIGFTKPDLDDDQDVAVLNDNLDKMEQAVKGKLTHPYGVYRKTDGFGSSIPNNSATPLVGWTASNTEYPDLQASSGALNIGYSAGIFTVPVNGIWALECGIRWALLGTSADTVGSRRVSIMLGRGGTFTDIRNQQINASNILIPQNYVHKYARLAANDQIRFDAVQSSGGALSLDATQSGLHIFCSLVCLTRLD
jgi:hypothetical protein